MLVAELGEHSIARRTEWLYKQVLRLMEDTTNIHLFPPKNRAERSPRRSSGFWAQILVNFSTLSSTKQSQLVVIWNDGR
jgi:hypothetical protein